MNINHDLLQLYISKKILTKKQADEIFEEFQASKSTSIREYLLKREITTDVIELPVLAEYYSMPHIEIDMLDIDRSLFNLFTFEFMKRYRIIPVSMSSDGKLLIATDNPLDCFARSAIASQLTCPT